MDENEMRVEILDEIRARTTKAGDLWKAPEVISFRNRYKQVYWNLFHLSLEQLEQEGIIERDYSWGEAESFRLTEAGEKMIFGV